MVKSEATPCSIHSLLSRSRTPSLSPAKQQRHRRNRHREFGRARSLPSPHHFPIDCTNSSALFRASTSIPLSSTSSLGSGTFCRFHHRCSRRSTTELHARRGQPQSEHLRSLSLPHLVFVVGPSILIHCLVSRYRLVASERVAILLAAAMAAVVHHLPPLSRVLG